ncbi:hypothetical protein AVEN_118472-1 [Araneus ventricosus]|uniref:Uncharacterized protein n=1 Tax=Araneus ventricosus TaxID=182803 RepID=A0A4Y2D1I8_ARAVE|nr:hypothetical protein AVEN_85203-1 [Araneus ventricosus]GBM10564.1 hypothetical protein AVEN_118472-1 [Araneus ventricosus]
MLQLHVRWSNDKIFGSVIYLFVHSPKPNSSCFKVFHSWLALDNCRLEFLTSLRTGWSEVNARTSFRWSTPINIGQRHILVAGRVFQNVPWAQYSVATQTDNAEKAEPTIMALSETV